MTRFLLDTSALSLLAPGRPDATPEFLAWVGRRDRDLYLSAITVAEVEQGIAKLRRLGGTRTPESLSAWLDDTLIHFAERVIAFDIVVAKLAGRMADTATASGYRPDYADLYIAATALAHDLTLLTRNIRHFQPLGIDVVDPLGQIPG